MKFYIDDQFLTTVNITKSYSTLSNEQNPTEEDLIKVLKGEHKVFSTRVEDHPEFAKLRNSLEDLKYIKTWRNCWNGDTVLKTFSLNDAVFEKNEQFPSGAAIKYRIESKLKK